MKHVLGSLAPLALAGLLAGCSTVQTSHDSTTAEAESRSSGFMNLVTNDDIEVRNAKAFAGIQDVVIGGFKVGFNESKTVTGSSKLVGGRTTGEMKLEGIDGATLQRITDQAYQDFVNRLEASGYRILPRETFTSHPLYAKLSEHDFPFRDDNSSLFSSYGVGNYYIPTAMGSKQVFFPDEVPQSKSSDLSAMFKSTPGQGLSAIGLTGTLQEFSEKTKVPLINVTYLVDFAAGSSAGFSMQQLKLGQLMSVDYGVLGLTTGYGGTFSSNNGKLALGQPVPSDKPFATMEDETSTGSQVAEGAFNLLFRGGILGAAGVGGDHTRTYVFRTEPEKFSAAALDVLDKTNALMVSKLAQLH